MLYFVLGTAGLILLVGGLIAGGTILSVAIAHVSGKDNPTVPHGQDKDTALASLWALFLIGTFAGLILLGIGVGHFTEDSPNPNQRQPSFNR